MVDWRICENTTKLILSIIIITEQRQYVIYGWGFTLNTREGAVCPVVANAQLWSLHLQKKCRKHAMENLVIGYREAHQGLRVLVRWVFN